MNVHPAGPRHAEEIRHAESPPRPQSPEELLRLAPNVWPRNMVRGDDRGGRIAGVAVTDLAQEYGTPLFVIDEDDFRSRCREIAAAFGGGANVHYAAKAFLCSEIARWIDEEGLSLDVCTGGELAVALHADFPPERITLHGNNKSVAELTAAVKAGVGHVVVDSMTEIERLDAIAGEAGVVQDVLGASHRRCRGAHPRVHLHRARGPEVRAVGGQRRGDGRGAAGIRHRSPAAGRAAQPYRFADLRRRRLRTRRAPRHRPAAARSSAEFGVDKTAQISTVDLGGGLGISYLAPDDPPPVAELAAKLSAIVSNESAAVGLPTPRLVVEPGRAIAGPGTITLYEVGTVKDVDVSTTAHRRYVSVDGGMSDNIRTALYDAQYDARLVSRISDAPATLARIVGKHCESGDIVVRDTWVPGDLRPGRPAGGGRDRCLLLFAVEPLQHDRPARRGRGARRAGPPDPAPGDGRRSAESGSEVNCVR